MSVPATAEPKKSDLLPRILSALVLIPVALAALRDDEVHAVLHRYARRFHAAHLFPDLYPCCVQAFNPSAWRMAPMEGDDRGFQRFA